jgi:hypothetical protein
MHNDIGKFLFGMIGVKVKIVPSPLNKVIKGSVIVGHSGNIGSSD